MRNQDPGWRLDTPVTRRRTLTTGITLAGSGFLATGFPPHARPALAATQATPGAPGGRSTSPAAQAADIRAMAEQAMTDYDLKAVIFRVTVDGEELVTGALGESMTGVPATPEMHFRNGAVAISYMATVLLILVDQGIVGLDDAVGAWLPDLPRAEDVTLRMLTNMTSGYADYVTDDGFIQAFNANPFRQWTPWELIDIGLSYPLVFEPGTNWNYAHTNYVILGQALERITGQPLAELIQELVLDPLGLSATQSSSTAAIPEPVLHACSSERRQPLGIEPDVRFYEESTFWNPSWTLAEGSVQTTNIFDMVTTAEAIGTGALLSPESHQAQIDPGLIGFGSPVAGCLTCHTMNVAYSYGLGVILSNSWVVQNPLFGGYGAVEAYLPSRKIAIAVATTFGEQSFDEQGNYLSGRASQWIFADIGAYLAPGAAPPART